MPAPEISVILPVYNGGRFLRGALDSLLGQTFRDFEIIAVDDGSTDRSNEILETCASADPRVRVMRRANTGIVGALNDGIAAATGEFIARMDTDDFSLPQRFEKQHAWLAAHPDCVALGTDVLYTDPEGAPLIQHHPVETHEDIMAQLLAGNGGALIHPTLMVRRRAIEVAGRYSPRYQWIEDLDLYLRLSDIGRLANLPEVHLHYRQHLSSINKIRLDREELRMELVNSRRSASGMAPLTCKTPPVQPRRAADWRRHWAYDAARGGNWGAAGRNAMRAVMGNPLDRGNWKCLRYALDRMGSHEHPTP